MTESVPEIHTSGVIVHIPKHELELVRQAAERNRLEDATSLELAVLVRFNAVRLHAGLTERGSLDLIANALSALALVTAELERRGTWRLSSWSEHREVVLSICESAAATPEGVEKKLRGERA